MMGARGSTAWVPRAPLVCALMVLLALLSGLGCAANTADDAEGPLWSDPGVVRLSPTRAGVVVQIHNRTGTVRPVGNFALAGDDWDALRFVDDSLPRTIPAYDSVLVELALSPATFRLEPGVYRSGQASLTFSSDSFAYATPIEFVGTEADRPRLGTVVAAALGLAGLALAFGLGPLRTGPSPARGSNRSDGARGLGFAIAAAFASALLLAATIPIGLGLCRGRLLDLVGPRELEQCRESLGGVELLALPGTPGIWWWLVALALFTATITIVKARIPGAAPTDPAPALALAALRLLGFALLLAALVCGLAPASASPTDLVLAQAKFVELAGLEVPRWGIVAQPLGFALGFALLVQSLPTKSTPAAHAVVATLERLNALLWASLLVTLYLGGPTIPALTERPVPLLAHAPELAVELLSFIAKAAAVLYLATRLQTQGQDPSQDQSQRVSSLARWIIPLALLNLATILIWRLI
ncbi:hypothetical protein DB30_04366 [Enhygromyxa salina]|uniref:Uncharacterized protein n=1 Tax=Enhygromyxa salina TaxID=215803 RepID=A0A0C2D4I8_9BACT|nr:hypothetical protein [Enhygromyxa salina]KIG16595.1 hypothetical protein DB30_04366 [Enhygromyxa salina]